jgi:hypothetical protein
LLEPSPETLEDNENDLDAGNDVTARGAVCDDKRLPKNERVQARVDSTREEAANGRRERIADIFCSDWY